VSRFIYDEKLHLEKQVPLGELIWLDRERCIQCARCIRFQDEVAGESVLGFDDRGRNTQIVSLSDPGFDSVFSGNTPISVPLARDHRDFAGARPWLRRRRRFVRNVQLMQHHTNTRAAKAGEIVVKRSCRAKRGSE
jgi:NADH-quinone oxidoreductase subunit G